MEKLLTIVIAAYNMEKYLPRCLDSIIVESVMPKVQVIVVNDGSKDKTSEIAHEYEAKYPNYIQVVDKGNGNYGSCMNVGLSLAKGKYFRTLDADDWYDSSNYERFVLVLEKTDADFLLCERFEYYEGTKIKLYISFDSNLPVDCDLDIHRDLWNNNSIMSLIHVSSISFKTNILRNCGLKWTENVFYTDNEFVAWPLPFIRTIRLVTIPVYVYLKGREEQSVSLDSFRKNFHSFDIVTNKVLDYFLKMVDETSIIFPLFLKVLRVDLFPIFYLTLFIDGLKNESSIKVIENKIKNNEILLEATSKINNYRGIEYVDAYRNNKVKFWLIRFDYLVRSNKILRGIFKKS